MSRPPDPSDPPAPAPPAVSIARLMFGPDPPPPDFELALVRVAVHHAVVLAAAAPEPEVEAFLGALYQRAEATQPPEARRDIADRLRAILAWLPPAMPRLPGTLLPAVVSVLIALDAAILRDLRTWIAGLGTEIGRQTRRKHAAQRELASDLVPLERTVVAQKLVELRRTRARYRASARLLARLASAKRPAGLTEEARQLVDAFRQAGLKPWPAATLAATVLRLWHDIPEDALTAAHIVARLQKRPRPTPLE